MMPPPNLPRGGKDSTFTQQFREIASIRSSLHMAVMAELVAETEGTIRETDRVNAENTRKAAAAAVAAAVPAAPAAAASPTTASPTTASPTTVTSNGLLYQADRNGDGSDSTVLIPVSRSGDYGGAALAAHSSPAGSSGGGTMSRPDDRRGEPLGTAASGEQASVNPGKASGLRVDGGSCPAGGGDDASVAASSATGTGGGRRDGDDNQATTAVAAVATAGRLPPAAVCAPGGGTRTDIRYLEDLLCSGPKGSRSNAVAAPNPKRKTRPRGGAGGDNGGSEIKKRPWKREVAASGPFSGLSLCVVRLGSVTNNTVGTLTREFRDGGGQVSTHYTPGDTTHIVADALLAASWEKLDDYFNGWDDFEDVVDGAGTAGRGRMPGGVPVVSSEWMSECLRRSEVVATDAYRLTPPPHRRAAPAAVAPKQQRSSTATKQANAAAEGCSSSASPAATGKKRTLTSGGEEATGGLVATRNHRADAAGGSASGGSAAAGSMNLDGEIGTRKPDVEKRRVSQGQPSSFWGPEVRQIPFGARVRNIVSICVRFSSPASKMMDVSVSTGVPLATSVDGAA